MSLKKNIVNLFGTQLISYVIPLLQLPYLSRVLDTDKFGLYIFSLSLLSICNIISNYGFELSIPKKIASEKINIKKLSIFISAINYIKTVLIIFLILTTVLINIQNNYFDKLTLVFIIISIISNGYNLIWLYLGIEKIYIYSRIIFLSRLISLISIFLFIKENSDNNILYIIIAMQNFLSTFICYYYLKRWKLKYLSFNLRRIKELAKESTEYFISRLGISLYSTCGSFFIGIMSGSMHQVAIYGAAEQLYKAGVMVISSISTPLTPYMARTKNFSTFFKITFLSICMTLLGASIGFFWGDKIISIIYSDELIEAFPVLKIFMITIIVSILGIHFGYPALIPLNKEKCANYSVLYAGLFQLLAISVFYLLNINITAVLIAISYLLCDSLMFLYRISIFYVNYKKR
ncbi:TPA: oligosaccharide flippase family protein [Proteus mirabilis]|nr:oligosaccharide flippase family protein [Proteus mirabilis]